MFLADSYLHNLDPFAIRFPSSWPIAGVRWYGLAYAVGFAIAWSIIRWFSKTGRTPLDKKSVGDLMFAVILGVLVGGRLGYVLFYDRTLLGFSPDFPFWNVLAINRGGMSSHGGMIGVIVACAWFARLRGVSSLHLLDMGSFACAPGLFLGRIANFINAELWGKPLPPHQQSYVPGQGLMGADPPWWSVKYPQEIVEFWTQAPMGDPRLADLEPLRSVINSGPDFYGHVVRAAQAGDPQIVAVVKPLLTAYYPSQLIQAITDGPLLMGFLALVWLRPRKPGVIGSWFLIVYGLMRIASEMFRQPDVGVPLTFGLSRGQLLSVAMIVAGMICLLISIRRQAAPIGGLMHRSR